MKVVFYSSGDDQVFLTEGKEYEVLDTFQGKVSIIDDEGDRAYYPRKYFRRYYGLLQYLQIDLDNAFTLWTLRDETLKINLAVLVGGAIFLMMMDMVIK